MTRIQLVLIVSATLALTACGGSQEPAPAAPPQQQAPAPVRGQGPATDLLGDQRIVAPGLSLLLPRDWVSETPSSQMRVAQARIPGDAGAGELRVFFFGPGSGGSVEANFTRWTGMVEADSEPFRDQFTLGGLNVSTLELSGTLLPSGMGGPSEAQPGSRMLAAVIEGPGGPWFFRATGPSPTMEAARDAFQQMLRSAEGL